MNCKRAARLLPLLAGEDLEPDARRRAAAHLERCPRCRAVERDLTEARRWLQSATSPPLTENVYAALRRDVWRQIEARRLAPERVSAGPGRLVLAGGGILAAALAALLIARRGPEPLRHDTASPVPSRIAETFPKASWPAVESPAHPAVAPPVAASRARSEPSSPQLESGAVRIEFRTANPNVRIIWLVRKGDEKSSASTASRFEEAS